MLKDQKIVDSIVQRNQEPFASHDASWDGLSDGGRIAPNGKYKFRVTPGERRRGRRGRLRATTTTSSRCAASTATATASAPAAATRARTSSPPAAPRSSPPAAARSRSTPYHSAAGYYVVIDGKKTGDDYVYMHLERQGRPKRGHRVKTGEVIGYESDTGNATGCHLHFELWSSPGWYEGGHVLDPTKPLKTWDSWSLARTAIGGAMRRPRRLTCRGTLRLLRPCLACR